MRSQGHGQGQTGEGHKANQVHLKGKGQRHTKGQGKVQGHT